MMSSKSVLIWLLGAAVAITMVQSQGFKPGQCPFIPGNITQTCNDSCTVDQSCPGEQVCCIGSCGGQECVDSVDDVPDTGLTRYSVLGCEGQSVTFSCPKGYTVNIYSSFWGRGDAETCVEDGEEEEDSYDIVCSGYYVYNILQNECRGQESCTVQAGIGLFGDPCSNDTTKYLKVEYTCTEKIYGAVVCENTGKLPITCPDNKMLSIRGAFYGRDTDNTTCPHSSTATGATNCSVTTAPDIVSQMCDGKGQCELDAKWEIFGDPCRSTYKYLEVEYNCIDCVNKYGDDALCDLYALIGDCQNNPTWMLENCRKSCWKCDDEEPVCENIHRNDTECSIWASEGNCVSDAAWMTVYCRKACTGCDSLTECKNLWDEDFGNEDCPVWYSQAQCSQNTHYMFYDCTKSCFGCNDDNFIRCTNRYFDQEQCGLWALQGECSNNPGFMLPNCFKDCMGCDADPQCENTFGDDAQCDQWERELECDRNPVFMHKSCWKSCMKCQGSPACVNSHTKDAECEYWAKVGQCDLNPNFMLTSCRKSCTRCGPPSSSVADCINVEPDINCENWAYSGQCADNPNWMIPNCKKSCLMCDREALVLRKVGAEPVPGIVNPFTVSRSFIVPGSFPYSAFLTHFMGFFVSTDPVYLQLWTPVNNTYVSVYNQRVTPSGAGYAQSFLVSDCVRVNPGDKLGFTSIGGMPAPIAHHMTSELSSITLFRTFPAVPSQQFVQTIFPFSFSLSVGYNDVQC